MTDPIDEHQDELERAREAADDQPFAPLGPVGEGRVGEPTALAEAVPEVSFRDMFRMTPEEEAEHEAYLAQRKRADRERQQATALKEWELLVPPALQATDWHDERLLPYREPIGRVLKWKYSTKGIYAVGRSGRGKSRAVLELARRMMVDQLVATRILFQSDITREINREGLNGWLEKLDGLRRVPVLAWDDFGKFAAIGSRKELLAAEIEALIDYRHSHGLPMLVSANAKEDDLIQIFGRLRGEPILRRLVEGCHVVSFGW